LNSPNSPYEPPASRPSEGGPARSGKSRLWLGFGLGWAAIALTFVWSFFLFPLASGLGVANEFPGVLVVWLLWFAPTLALLGYFASRREWKAVFGALLAWASAIAAIVLLVAACFGIAGLFS
jgi:hypothetical protein